MLTKMLLLAAQTASHLPEQLSPEPPSKVLGLSLRDISLVLGVVAILALSLFLYVYWTRRDRRGYLSRTGGREIRRAERRSHRESHNDTDERERVKKKRRRHPDFLPRNPTLGETGGLPPIRPDEPAQPTA